MPVAVTQTKSVNTPTTSQEESSPYQITEEILLKKLERENKGRYLTQLLVTLIVSVASLNFGLNLGWSNPVTIEIDNAYNLTNIDYGWVTSLMPLGCSIGVIPWSISVNKYGPKQSMLVQTPLYLLTSLIVISADKLDTYLAGRFFYGFFTMGLMIGGECLLLDSIHQSNYPHMITIFRSSVFLGVLLSVLIGILWTRAHLMIICACLSILNGLLLFIIPESPVFLFNTSELKAIAALSWIRGKSNTTIPIRKIRKDAEAYKISFETSRYMFHNKVVLKGFFIVFGLTFFQVFSGYYAFIFYNIIFWLWVEGSEALFRYSVIFCICVYLSNIMGQMLQYHAPCGNRQPILISTTLVSVSLTILTFYLYLWDEGSPTFILANWIPLVGLNCYVISYEIGLGNYGEVLLFDYLPYQVYGRAKTLICISYWFQNYLLLKYFIVLKRDTSFTTMFAILTIVSYISILYTYIFVIESKGKSLMQIQLEIGGNPVGSRGAYRNRLVTPAQIVMN